MAMVPRLIFCHDGNPAFARIAVECGWLYGARLPATVYERVYFADQDWREPDRKTYMAALARHRPVMATVVDWETDSQLPDVLSWAEEAAQWVAESVLIVPKVVGGVPRIPRSIGGKRVVLAYSVPTKYGGSPLALWELDGWPVHLLGGSPQEQMKLWSILSCRCEVVSVDGNMTAKMARSCRFWSRTSGPKGKWWQLRDGGDDRTEGADAASLKRSLTNIRNAWLEKGT